MSLYNSYLSSMVLVWKYYTCIWSLYLWLKDSIDRLFDVGFEDVGFRQLLVPMGGQPDPGQRALLGQHEVGVEHHAPNFWRPTSKSHKVHGSFRGPTHKKRGFSTFYFYFQNYSFAAVVKQSRWPPNIARTIVCISLLINFYSSHHWGSIKQHSDIYVVSFLKLTYHLLTRRGRFFSHNPLNR